ncbi:DUF169 domain-containing protein [Chloroflexota bacterium]
MTAQQEYNTYGLELERLLLLRTSPIAVKMLESEDDIPPEAYRPMKDNGVHIAQCQAFTMSRRRKQTVAMLKEDNWCWAPLVAWGLVEPPDPETIFGASFPCFEREKYIGLVTAPLSSAGFEPDMVLIYSNTAQLRNMLSALKSKENPLVSSVFDPIDSCVYSIVPTITTGECRITLPDPGEYERAMAGEDEIIFSVPVDKLERLVSKLQRSYQQKRGYAFSTQDMQPDFPRPAFYEKLFKEWGLDVKE